MKKILLCLVAVGVGLVIVLISVLHVGKNQWVAAAVEEKSWELILGEAASGSAEKIEGVKALGLDGREGSDYYLPYPGLLPDHPFYFIKMMRDRLMLWLARTPEQRIERLLLYADKRIGAALVLVEGGKKELGAKTALKAEQYLLQAGQEVVRIDDERLRETLRRAREKHEEVLVGIEAGVEGGGLDLVKEARAVNLRIRGELEGGR